MALPEQKGVRRVAGGFVLLGLLLALLIGPAAFVQAGEDCQPKTRLLRNQEYGETLLQGIMDARKSILCAFYLFKMGEGSQNRPRRIAEELVRARKRGVEVVVILERDTGKRGTLMQENRSTAAFLSRGGVKVFFDSPSVVTHTKAAVIDSRYVYLGSHNLTQGALRHNNELSVLIDSPEMAAEVTAYLGRL